MFQCFQLEGCFLVPFFLVKCMDLNVVIRTIVQELFQGKNLTVSPLLFEIYKFFSMGRRFLQQLLQWILVDMSLVNFDCFELFFLLIFCLYILGFTPTDLGKLRISLIILRRSVICKGRIVALHEDYSGVIAHFFTKLIILFCQTFF